MAHIRPRARKGGKVVYQVNIRHVGRAHRAKTFATLEEAKDWEKKVESSARGPAKVDVHPIPPRHGVYVIWAGKTCLYVGSSMSNIMERISKHCGTEATHYSVVECPADQLLAVEYRLIAELQPTKNAHGTMKHWRRVRGAARG